MGRDGKKLGAGYIIRSFRLGVKVFGNGKGKVGDGVFGKTSGEEKK